jgi:hypothetical protein
MSFLPDDYTSPKSSDNYMKLQDGENRIRILSKPILGYEDWTVDKRPVRYPLDKKPPAPIDATKPIKHFWAFIVWNHADEKIQIMQITQATIRMCLEALARDADWADPFHYDIKIVKEGSGKESKYTVNPVPHKPLDPYIITQFMEKRINLDALFTGADPFASGQNYTPLGIDVEVVYE